MGALIGMAGAGAGFGLALLGYIDVLPFGWRFLYVVGTVPLLATAWLRRSLKETKVFEAHRQLKYQQYTADGGGTEVVEPPPLSHDGSTGAQLGSFLGAVAAKVMAGWRTTKDAFRTYPVRMVASCMIRALAAAEGPGGGAFVPKYMYEVVGLTPHQFSDLALNSTGLLVTCGVMTGQLNDILGRRLCTSVYSVMKVILLILTFSTTNQTALFWLFAWRGFFSLGLGVCLSLLLIEPFPTSHRATAAAIQTIASTLASSAFLAAEGVLYRRLGSHWSASSYLTLLELGVPIFAVMLPEGKGKELDEIAQEPVPMKEKDVSA